MATPERRREESSRAGVLCLIILVFEHEVCGAGGVEVEGRYGVFPGAVEYVSAQCVYVVESGGIGRCGVSLEAFYGFGTAEDLNAGLVGGSGGRLRGTHDGARYCQRCDNDWVD